MRKFVTPILKLREHSRESQDSKDPKSKSSSNMFEDDLGDDFLNSWKPTKMAADVELDLVNDQVQLPKAIVRKAFASTKMEMDFDFDGGFGKLSSFDIDLSLGSPPSGAKKTKIDPPKKLKPENDVHDKDIDLAFDFGRFDTLDLEDTSLKKIDYSGHKSEPNGQLKKTSQSDDPPGRVSDIVDTDCRKSESSGKDEASEELTVNIHEEIPSQYADSKNDSEFSSPLSQPVSDFTAGHHSSGNKNVVDREKSVSPDCELMKTVSTTSTPPVFHTVKEGMAEASWLHSGKESDFVEKSNSVRTSETRPVEKQSTRPEQSDTMNEISGIKCSDQDYLELDSTNPQITKDPVRRKENEYTRTNQKSRQTTLPTGVKSSTKLIDKQQTSTILDSGRSRSLQFDPLFTSSQNNAAEVQENRGHPENRHELKCSDLEATSIGTRIENYDHEIVSVPGLDERPNPASRSVPTRDEDATKLHAIVHVPVSNTSIPRSSERLSHDSGTAVKNGVQNVTIKSSNNLPVVAILPSVSQKGRKESQNKAGSESALLNSTPISHCATLGDKRINPSCSNQASAMLRARSDQLNLKVATAVGNRLTTIPKESESVPNQVEATPILHCETLGDRNNHSCSNQASAMLNARSHQLDLKTATAGENRHTMVPKEKKGVPNHVEAKLHATKRPVSVFLQSSNRLQPTQQQTSQIYPEEQEKSGHEESASTKNGGRKVEKHFKVRLTTTAAPVPRKSQEIHVQNSGRNTLRPQNQPSERPLTSSKFLSTYSLKSSDRDTRHQIPRPVLGKTTTLLSSVSSQARKPSQLYRCKLTLHFDDFKLLGSTTSVVKSITVSGNDTALKRTVWVSKGVEMKREKREKAIENNEDITVKQPFRSSAHAALQDLLLRKPEREGPKYQAKKIKEQEVQLELSDSPTSHGGSLQKQSLPMSNETQMGVLPAQSPLDLLINQSSDIMEQSNRHTDKRDGESPASHGGGLQKQDLSLSNETQCGVLPAQSLGDPLFSQSSNTNEKSNQCNNELDNDSPTSHGGSLEKQDLPISNEKQMGVLPAQSPVDPSISQSSNIMEQPNQPSEKLDAESPASHCGSLQEQNLPVSDETQRAALPAQSPVDLLISQSSDIVKQSDRYTDKLDFILKTLTKLNDDAQDLMVRALVNNNAVMMLNSPVIDDKIQRIKASVMEALGSDCSPMQID